MNKKHVILYSRTEGKIKEMERKENNLFAWATSELSQDAVLLWLLFEDVINAKTVSFLTCAKGVRQKNYNNTWTIEKICMPQKQKNHIDIFLEFSDTDGKTHALIVEDKTNTEMHDQQMIKYLHQVARMKPEINGERYDYIHFVLFKTGLTSFVELDHYDAEIDSILGPLDPREGCIDEKNVNKKYDLRYIVRHPNNDDILNALDFFHSKKQNHYSLSFHYVDADDFLLFIKDLLNNQKGLPGWFPDYANYYTKLIDINRESIEKGCNPFFMNQNNSTKAFAERVTGNAEYRCDFLKPEGKGERVYDFVLQGMCGENRPEDNSTRNRFFLLPYITFKCPPKGPDRIEATIALHFAWMVDPKDSRDWGNYVPYKKLEQLGVNEKFKGKRDFVTSFFDKKHKQGFLSSGFKVCNGEANGRLQIIKHNPIPIDSDLLEVRFQELIGLCEELITQLKEMI